MFLIYVLKEIFKHLHNCLIIDEFLTLKEYLYKRLSLNLLLNFRQSFLFTDNTYLKVLKKTN